MVFPIIDPGEFCVVFMAYYPIIPNPLIPIYMPHNPALPVFAFSLFL